MKQFIKHSLVVVASASILLSGQNLAAQELKTEALKESYSIGASLGNYLSNQIYNQSQLGVDANVEVVIEGFVDALKNQQQLTDEDLVTYLNSRADKLNKESQARAQAIALKNKQEGEVYLAQHKAVSNVKLTESGLQYQVLSLGEGRKPNPEDVVTVNYKGTLIDGTEFDNTYARGEPSRFALLAVIPGWEEGIRLMPEGSKFEFVVPSELAYGEQGIGAIPGNSTLIFEVELLKVEKPSENAKGMGMGIGHG
jgi:FKBP-type peptidyl-prolyl cis-trans isomerase FkpA